jgi:hypothetical protein
MIFDIIGIALESKQSVQVRRVGAGDRADQNGNGTVSMRCHGWIYHGESAKTEPEYEVRSCIHKLSPLIDFSMVVLG